VQGAHQPAYPLVELLGRRGGLVSGALRFSTAHRRDGVPVVRRRRKLIDFDTQLLPDSITLPLLWLGLLVNAGGLFTDPRSAVIGAAAGYLALWSVYWVFKFVTGKEGWDRRLQLLAAIGAWCGCRPCRSRSAVVLHWAAVGIALMIFSGTAAACRFLRAIFGRRRIVALFWGPRSPPYSTVHVKPYTVGSRAASAAARAWSPGCSPNAGRRDRY